VRVLNPSTLQWEEGNDLSVIVEPHATAYRFLAAGSDDFLAKYRVAFSLLGARLIGAYPNPFGNRVTIRYSLPYDNVTSCVFAIYDLCGRLVWKTAAKQLSPGIATLSWNGRMAGGARLASGVYVLRMSVVSGLARRQKVFEQRIIYAP
jgi:hypothetical protein